MTAATHPAAVPFTTADYAARIERVVADGRAAGLDGVLVTPSPDLVWLGEEPVGLIHAPDESVGPGEIQRPAEAEALLLQRFADSGG